MREYGWRRITARERCEASQYIDLLPENTQEERRTKKVLTYFVIDNMCASAISRLNDPDIVCFGNRKHGFPLSACSILRIVYEHFPQFHGRIENTDENKRVELKLKRRKTKSPHKRQCAFCGSHEQLEEHHMIPLFMGGTNDDRNLIFLCRDCHSSVTAYQRNLMMDGVIKYEAVVSG